MTTQSADEPIGSDQGPNTYRKWVEVGGRARSGLPAFETEETQGMGPDGYLETEMGVLHTCPVCGGVMRQQAEAGGACPCGVLICATCVGRRRCSMSLCRQPTCLDCGIDLFGRVYHRAHARLEVGGFALAALVLTGALMLAVAILS